MCVKGVARILAPFQGAVPRYLALTRGCARFNRLTPGYVPSRLRRGRRTSRHSRIRNALAEFPASNARNSMSKCFGLSRSGHPASSHPGTIDSGTTKVYIGDSSRVLDIVKRICVQYQKVCAFPVAIVPASVSFSSSAAFLRGDAITCAGVMPDAAISSISRW